MKEKDNEPQVEFSILADYRIPLSEAERILGMTLEVERKAALLATVKLSVPANSVLYDHNMEDFDKGVGKALLEKRRSELRQLAAICGEPKSKETNVDRTF